MKKSEAILAEALAFISSSYRVNHMSKWAANYAYDALNEAASVRATTVADDQQQGEE